MNHGPDGLSHCTHQLDDVDKEDNHFEDWIDHLHCFIHIINAIEPTTCHETFASSFVSIFATAQISGKEKEDIYVIIHNPKMQKQMTQNS